MGVPTISDVWAKDFDGLPFLNEGGSPDILDLEAAEAVLSQVDVLSTSARLGGSRVHRAHRGGTQAVNHREQWIRSFMADAGIGSAEDIDNEEVFHGLFG
jgi:hypothetical protein